MKNECLNVAAIMTFGGVIAFFSALGYFTRAAYLNGFAAGFTEARARFLKVIKAAKAEKLFKSILADLERGSDDNPLL